MCANEEGSFADPVAGTAWIRPLAALAAALALGISAGCSNVPTTAEKPSEQAGGPCLESNTMRAEVVAFEQAYVLNRFGAYVPAGMMYALKRDVVALDDSQPPGPGNAKLRPDKRPRPLVLRAHEGGCLEVTLHNWLSPQWHEEGSGPPESTMQVAGRKVAAAPAHLVDPPGSPTSRALKPLATNSIDAPRTRSASFFVTGLEIERPWRCPLDAVCGGDGTYVGLPERQATFFHRDTPQQVKDQFRSGSVIQPGQISVTLWIAKHEGTYFAHSMGAPVGGEGDGGQIGLGLFAAVNVEPPQSRWYRSQVTAQALTSATRATAGRDAHPYERVSYEALSLTKGNEIIDSDLNAIIVRSRDQRRECEERLAPTLVEGQRCEPAFREFTVVLHDQVHAVQAFPELEDIDNPLHYVKDGMGINYGVSGLGSAAYAAKPQRGVGPAAKCPECRAEEFFLTSWANGDPALVLKWDEQGARPVGARYPDDPSNVHHSYLGDPVVFRNLHAGPKETHVFHLHAHQWVLDASDPNSTYLDSQTISPGATFSYGIEFGGSGNRNFTVGDSIFHCHLYPHFAQGMWELWRVHDVFENGLDRGVFDPARPVSATNDPRTRTLPDGEVREGIVSPALVPLPGLALAPMPSLAFRGYPFFIPGEAGHRPPQPVLDMDVDNTPYAKNGNTLSPADAIVNGGLPRHVVKEGSVSMLARQARGSDAYKRLLSGAMAKGGEAAQLIGEKVATEYPLAFEALAGEWDRLVVKELPHQGTKGEQTAMRFHEGKLQHDAPLAQGGLRPVVVSSQEQPRPGWWTLTGAYRTAFAATTAQMDAPSGQALFRVNGRGPKPGAPFANPCPQDAPVRQYRAAFIQTELTMNRHGWFDPQGRIMILEDDIKDVIDANRRTRLPEPLFFRANSGDCIEFTSSNFIPSALNADDFQIYTPTDTIGQHIHLVKFDVTSSDGSGNGWNYEDGSFSPDEVRERIAAINQTAGAKVYSPKVHPLFRPAGTIGRAAANDAYFRPLADKGQCPPQGNRTDHEYLEYLNRNHPYCGAQRTHQRWWADPIIVRGSGPTRGKDNTLRTVFSHDHFGPSSHQQHGLYAALVIEPANSVWRAELPAGAQRRAAVEQACRAASAAGRKLAPATPRSDLEELDQGIAASFAIHRIHSDGSSAANLTRAERQQIDLALAAAKACLENALIGGADLSAPIMALGGVGDEQIAALAPRPPFRHSRRADGGPTATRATIVSPACLNDPSSSPYLLNTESLCPGDQAAQTRREFGVAFADFSIVYNLALEPINTEKPRDVSARRFGERQVAVNPSRPLAITSEDPGTQLINYRNEPLALRIADIRWDSQLGGFSFEQSKRRSDDHSPCAAFDRDCQGDMANAFASEVHAQRERALASNSYDRWLTRRGAAPAGTSLFDMVLPAYRALPGRDTPQRVRTVVNAAEGWRQGFNCALYDSQQWRPGLGDAIFMRADEQAFRQFCSERTKAGRRAMEVLEPGRVFGDPATPLLLAYEGDPVQIRLIQGAQEAQHVFAMNGVKWHRMPDSPNSGYTNAQPLGISEHFEFDVRVPDLKMPHVDYLYYGSSVDQLWDGMWGALRAFCDPRQATCDAKAEDAGSSGANKRDIDPDHLVNRLARVPLATPTPAPSVKAASAQEPGYLAACTTGRDPDESIEVKSFDVSVERACTLLGNCGQPLSGTVYSQRFGIHDPKALVYVLNAEQSCTRTAGQLTKHGCYDGADRAVPTLPSHETAHRALLYTFQSDGRRIEPLVLRAAAGQCMTVKLRNYLQPEEAPRELLEADAYYNFLPMITDGFNLNQFQMSATVSLSAPRVTQNPLVADGSNVGLNGAIASVLVAAETFEGEPAQAALTDEPGSLVPPCRSADDVRKDRCSRSFVWSATDLTRTSGNDGTGIENRPVEFGALPLSSFGDAIKHPMHGLIGALVIGPEGSVVCPKSKRRFPGGTSSRICPSRGKGQTFHPYGDHVLMMQDAVSAIQGGFPVPDLSGAEEPDDYGVKAINYRTEPLWARRGASPSVPFGDRNGFDYTDVFSSARQGKGCQAGIPPLPGVPAALSCDPETPVLTATAGEPIRLHFVHPGGHTRQHAPAVAGHGFHPFSWDDDSRRFAADRCDATQGPIHAGCLVWQGVYNGFGPKMGITLGMKAGGTAAVAKDYLVRNEASYLLDGGLWGILRVQPDKTGKPTSQQP